MKKLKNIILIFAFTTLIYSQTYVDAIRLSEPTNINNARTLGMGNAVLTIGDSYSSSLFNPATLGLLKNKNINIGMSSLNYSNETTFMNSLSKASEKTINFDQVGIAIPLPVQQGSFVLSFGYNKTKDFYKLLKFDGFNSANNSMIQDLTNKNDDMAFDLRLSYSVKDNEGKHLNDATKINGKLNQKGDILDEGSLSSYNFGGAVEFSKDFFVGLGFNIYSGKFSRNRNYYEIDSQNNYQDNLMLDDLDPRSLGFKSFYFNDKINWNISGWDFKAGFLFDTQMGVKFAGTVKFPTKFTIEESYRVKGVSEFKDHSFEKNIDNSKIEYRISTPFEISIGGSYELANLKLAANLEFVDYKQMEFTEGLSIPARNINNQDIKDFTRMVSNINLGAEFELTKNISLRGGFIYKQSPYKDDLTKYDKKYITAGFGYQATKFVKFDLAYSYGWWDDLGDNYGSNISRTFQQINKNNLVISLNYNF